jgi:hypothetical protein
VGPLCVPNTKKGFWFRDKLAFLMNPKAQQLFNLLSLLFASLDIRQSFETQLHNFLHANGQPRPQQSKSKSPGAISRMFNHYAFPSLALIRTTRAFIEQQIWQYVERSKKRRPPLELMIDLTSLEKTGAFPDLPVSFFNHVFGLHIVVLYVMLGDQRFPWAMRVWRGEGTTTWVQHALSMLRCLPAWFSNRFRIRVLADGGFGSTEFIEGCAELKYPVLVGMACDRKTKQGFRLDQLALQGTLVELRDCRIPVYVAWFKLKGKNGWFEWRYIVSTVAATAQTMIRWGKRRWRIEAFFKTMKSRFGLDQFGQRTLRGVLRFLLLALIAFVLVAWFAFPFGDEHPDWQALAQTARLWLLTWVVQFEVQILQAKLDEVLELKAKLIA